MKYLPIAALLINMSSPDEMNGWIMDVSELRD